MHYLYSIHAAEERVLLLCLLRLVELPVTDDGVKEQAAFPRLGKVLLTLQAEAVEAAAVGKAFKSLPVHIADIDTLGKVVDVLVKAVLLPFTHNALGGTGTHPLDGGESEAYLAAAVHAEADLALVDVRAERGDLHRLALLHQFRDFSDLAETACHQRSHVFSRIMRLQVGGLVGYP